MDLEAVLRDLVSDPRLKNHQFFEFKEYKDDRGVRVFGEANGSLMFQYAAARVGPGKVPLAVVVYIDGTFIKQNIHVKPIYGRFV